MKTEREQLIEAAERAYYREQCRQMSREQLNEIICTSVGVPIGTPFTREQLKMIRDSPGQL